MQDFIQEHKKPLGIAAIALLIVIIVAIIHAIMVPKQFTDLKAVPNAQVATNQQIKNNKADHFTYEFFYQPKCPDCKHMEKQTIKPIYKLQKQGKLEVFNAKNKKTLRYLQNNQITETPTLVVKYHGYIAYQYAGRNPKAFTRLLNNRNPETNQKLKIVDGKPEYTQTLNDFAHYRNSEAPVRHNSMYY